MARDILILRLFIFAYAVCHHTVAAACAFPLVYPRCDVNREQRLMSRMQVRDPERRATIAEALEHPWIVRYSRRRQLTDVRVKRSNTGGLSMPLGGASSTPGHTPSAVGYCLPRFHMSRLNGKERTCRFLPRQSV